MLRLLMFFELSTSEMGILLMNENIPIMEHILDHNFMWGLGAKIQLKFFPFSNTRPLIQHKSPILAK